jgi:nitric-oxide synthase, bacterial
METLQQEAEAFIHQMYREKGKPEAAGGRIREIEKEIQATGTYTHTYEELSYGAKLAWRNSNKCIGRLFWENLHVFDARHIHSAEKAAEAAREHLRFAAGDGKIRPTVTVFPQRNLDGEDPLFFHNHQLIRYAGYETGRGDPHSLETTHLAESLGWRGSGGDFDLLPLLIQEGEDIHMFPLDQKQDVQEIDIVHPEEEKFKELGLKWYTVPAISDMAMNIGGITYGAAPFNGWYMGTEIAARNFADSFRYDKLKQTAEMLGLNTSKISTLWKDRALVELNRAVLYSFQEAGAGIVDHHTASEQFRLFCGKENQLGRKVTGDWTWLIPPVSPASVHIFHEAYDNMVKTPNFFYRNSTAENKCPFIKSKDKSLF